jgi:serine/threonine protein kinase
MTPERWQQINELYHNAVELDASGQATFLNQACAGDAELRDEVESLIASHDQAGSFISEPALKVAAKDLAEDQATSLVGRSFSHYRIESILGVGGMGEVYLAEDNSLDRKVALKLLPAQFTNDAERLRRFEREARAASALNHPNILTIYEIGQADGHHYTVTEFIDGETLREHMAGTHMKLDESLDIATQVASALTAAHEAGIVHRDIKPENVMLRSDGFVKVLDFGLAKLLPRHASATEPEALKKAMVKTNPGMVMGTTQYMSPEQARGQDVDARTDIWSLGVVLYEMVTGRAPFAGETPSHAVVSILETQPLPLTHENEMTRGLERIVDKALRKNREERYRTVTDLLLDLKSLKQELEVEAHLERARSETVGLKPSGGRLSDAKTAPPQRGTPKIRPSSAEPVFEEIKRHKRGAAIAVAAIIVVLATLAYSFYLKKNAGHLATTGEAIDSLAVLPFFNESGDPNTEYLADGISDSVINSLSRLPKLKVISLNAVMRYRGKQTDPQTAGRDLSVGAVLIGRMTQRGDDLKISTELVDVRDNSRLWGEQYHRKLSDILSVQEEIARKISEGLRLRLSGEERKQLAKKYTENSDAYLLYSLGRHQFNNNTKAGFEKSIEYYEQAIRIDPKYALAYVGLSGAYHQLEYRGFWFPKEAVRKQEWGSIKGSRA